MTTGIKKTNDYYLNLVTDFPPRPISNEAELTATKQRINGILDENNLTPDDRDYLRVLSVLVYEYEEKHEPIPELKDGELLQALIEELGLQIQDFLPIFDTEETVLEILQGCRTINPQQSRKLMNKYYQNDRDR
jgi:HTH-type transcriptional regulator/antitoxin HigA